MGSGGCVSSILKLTNYFCEQYLALSSEEPNSKSRLERAGLSTLVSIRISFDMLVSIKESLM